ncbi:MAG: 23S rRNA (guanosine2251-2'-O)-methyltransferase [Flavobacteriaceae bacterium]|jgi:23S rRNA (guanosine2251-2'-O)-methyltransferase
MKTASRIQKKIIHLVLLDLRSVYNVGSLFRTADAIGVSKIYCVGTTPSPLDRFGRERKDIAKVALGAEKNVSWEYCENEKDLFEKLKEEGFVLWALEQDEKSKDYKEVAPSEKTALVLGNEPEGISKETLSLMDEIVEIPLYGKKESLNVSVAGGIALFGLFDK